MPTRHRRAEKKLSTPIIVGIAVVAALIAAGLTIVLTSGDGKKSGGSSSDAAADAGGPKDPDNPLSGRTFYVNPANRAAQQYQKYKKDGDADDAEQMEKIATRPIAQWLGGETTTKEVAGLVSGAEKAGQTAVLTVYNVPHRDCGQYSSGGAEDADSYRAYVDKIAAGLSGHGAVIILEPDAVAHTLDECLDQDEATERTELLEYAITTLKKNHDVAVYVDAGNAGWKDPDQMAEALTKVGIEHADGFAVNVSNFYTTDESTSYGQRISKALDGKHFVIDTSRNGNGPYDESDDQRWCNPPGRALGQAPSSKTGVKDVDAYLWVKQPGDSDGSCRDGEPAAGQWWPEYALHLAEASS